MRAAVLLGKEDLAVQEVKTPAVEGALVLVRLKSCGICTLEQRLFSGAVSIGYPIIPGHEASGEIVSSGPDVHAPLVPGTRAALDLVTRCGECRACRTGRSNLCEYRFDGKRPVLGGFGEYVAVPASQVYPLPDSVSFQAAAFSEPLACSLHSLNQIRLEAGEELLIFGAGTMGLLHLQAARAMGARVWISDPDSRRRDLALRLGAAGALNPYDGSLPAELKRLIGGRLPEAAVVTTTAPGALEKAFQAVETAGRICLFTSYLEPPPIPADAHSVHRRELVIAGSEGRTERDFLRAVRLLSFGRIETEPLVSLTVGLDSLEAGIRGAMRPDTLRVVLRHGEAL